MLTEVVNKFRMINRPRLAVGLALIAAGLIAVAGLLYPGKALIDNSEMSSQSRQGSQRYTPTPAEWASLTIQPVTERAFRAEHITEGKIAVDEDRSSRNRVPRPMICLNSLIEPTILANTTFLQSHSSR
jgi:cobalt-zinc-cadmium efflux system membrane fusion protein